MALNNFHCSRCVRDIFGDNKVSWMKLIILVAEIILGESKWPEMFEIRQLTNQWTNFKLECECQTSICWYRSVLIDIFWHEHFEDKKMIILMSEILYFVCIDFLNFCFEYFSSRFLHEYYYHYHRVWSNSCACTSLISVVFLTWKWRRWQKISSLLAFASQSFYFMNISHSWFWICKNIFFFHFPSFDCKLRVLCTRKRKLVYNNNDTKKKHIENEWTKAKIEKANGMRELRRISVFAI